MRDEMLANWVEQPPAPPVLQYLRDAEKDAAIDLVGSRERVLDLASESNITKGLNADEVVRLDFSEKAIEFARETIGDDAQQYEWVDPQDPQLPFPDDHFDGAVCIGPYDWKFLDVETLTREVARVVDASGEYVFSTPTPRSPYHIGSKNTQRFYTPEEALSLVNPGWELTDYELIYQYHYRVQDQVWKLDDETQEKFASLAHTLTDVQTALDVWSNASYIVLKVSPTDYADYAERALDALCRPVADDGFWDDDHLIRALRYEVRGHEFAWTPEREVQRRYATFALMGLMEWRESAIGHDGRDEYLREQLDHLQRAVDDRLEAMPSYGIGPMTAGFARAARVFDEPGYRETAVHLFEHARERFDFDHSEDCLLLCGWATLYELTGDEDVLDAVEAGLWTVADRQEPDGVFEFDNETTRRHQNQMYTVWGLSRAIEVTGLTGFLDDAERVLDYTIDERMRDDGAFIWEDLPLHRRAKTRLGRLKAGKTGDDDYYPHWRLLYECHQTFFVNAVARYYAAGGTKDYDLAVGRAINWVFGENALDRDLVDVSGIGVPMRFLTVDGDYDEPGHQQYKGTYEIGSWLGAMAALADPERL